MGDAQRRVDGRCVFVDARELGTSEGAPRKRFRILEGRQDYEAGTDQLFGPARPGFRFGQDLLDSRVLVQGHRLRHRIKESHLDFVRP